MEINKLQNLVSKYKLSNIIKIFVILIVLYLLSRLLIPSLDSARVLFKVVEGFQTLGYSYYGNQISLQDPTNIPVYAGNTCTFKFDGVYRIEALSIKFNNNNNSNLSSQNNSILPFNPDNINTIYIQYEDGNGNLRYIKSSINSSPPNFYNTTNLSTTTTSLNKTSMQSMVSIGDITDENNLVVYTSRIIITIGDITNKIDSYIDYCNTGYISNFAFWGSTRDMLSKKDFENLSPTLSLRTFAYGGNNFDETTSSDIYTYTTPTDFLLYGISINYNINSTKLQNTNPEITQQISLSNELSQSTLPISATPQTLCKYTTNSPFKLSILYNNGLYTGNNFTINNTYIVRNDPLVINSVINTDYIIFAQPIIANKLVITIPRVNITNNTSQNIVQLICNGLQGYGTIPSTSHISDYQRTINALLSSSTNGQNLDICPSVDDLVIKQNKAQQICDNLEYQDKVKSEKLRLERNKQYLLKLQQQQQQIDQLNQVIQTLDTQRHKRAQTSDIARILQYQQQKATASSVRDIANQRLQSQDNNQLYLDVNINNI